MAYTSNIAHQEYLAEPRQVAAPEPITLSARTAAPYRHLHARAMLILSAATFAVDLALLLISGWLSQRGAVSAHLMGSLSLAAALFIPLFSVCRLGQRTTLQRPGAALLRPLLAQGLCFAGVAAASVAGGLTLGMPTLLLWAAASSLGSIAVRSVLCQVLNHHPVAARWQKSIAFIGNARDIAQFFASLPSAEKLPLDISGYYSLSRQPEVALSGLTHLGSIADQDYLLLNRPLDRLIIVAREIDTAQLNGLLGKLEALACPVDLCLLPLVEVAPVAADAKAISDVDLLLRHCRLIPLQDAALGLRSRATKRLFDIVASAVAIVALSPLLAGAALAVRLSSPGPVLFRQPRWGRNGQTFHILKFRSMYVHACDSGRGSVQQATREDPRITPVGRFLRKTSIDELPQLFNVLKGNMSLIGPRPHAVAHNELYARQVRGYVGRHRAKPGLSGWAQVHGYRGETPQVQMMQKRIDFDADYISNWSLLLDLRIIWKTVGLILSRKNAW